ncbi:MAG: hypothetical protein SF028_02520, partial [Candidatus Sumerlaeia bacterium]|nr:hypothetical protein [Candidatus Sumerlaeia bacterium]
MADGPGYALRVGAAVLLSAAGTFFAVSSWRELGRQQVLRAALDARRGVDNPNIGRVEVRAARAAAPRDAEAAQLFAELILVAESQTAASGRPAQVSDAALGEAVEALETAARTSNTPSEPLRRLGEAATLRAQVAATRGDRAAAQAAAREALGHYAESFRLSPQRRDEPAAAFADALVAAGLAGDAEAAVWYAREAVRTGGHAALDGR